MRVLGQLGWVPPPPGWDVWEWGSTISFYLYCRVAVPLCHGRKNGACIREATGDPPVEEGLPLKTCFREGDPHMCPWEHIAARQLGWVGSSFPIQRSFPQYGKQWWSAWYLLEVSCAADRSPFSPTRAPLGSPVTVQQGKFHGLSWDFLIAGPLWLASGWYNPP